MPASTFAHELVQFIQETFGTKDFIPLHAPQLDQQDEEAVRKVVESGYISTVGETVRSFEQTVVEQCDVDFAVAVANGTSALHLGLLALGVSNDDLVLTQAMTFVATANAIKYCGADPIFVDIQKATLGMCPISLSNYLEENAELNSDGICIHVASQRVIKACIPMHNLGHSCAIKEIKSICEKWHISLLEDSAEALGSISQQGHKLGTIGDAGVYSFNGNKIISTGGGGMFVTNSALLAERVRHLSTTAKVAHPWHHDHDEIGFNYRLPALNAALGVSQMSKLELFIDRKRLLADHYSKWFYQKGYEFFKEPKNTLSNYWINAFFAKDKEERDIILSYTNANGVMTRSSWNSLTDMAPYAQCMKGDLKETKRIHDRLICIPSSVVSLKA